MQINEAVYVLAIEKHRTIYRAAEELGISQPALSRFLQSLEKNLGVKLFERSKKRLLLTYAGEQYIAIAKEILQLNQTLERTLAEFSQQGGGQLSLGVTPARGRYVLPNVLPAFREQYPRCKIKVVESGVDELERCLRTGEIDLAVYTVFDEYSADFNYVHIATEELVLCGDQNSPYLEQGRWRKGYRFPWLDLRKMGHELFVMVSTTMRTGQVAYKLLSEAEITPETITVSYVETAISIAAQGMGLCFCTDLCAKFFTAIPKPVFFSVGEKPSNWDFVIATRKGGIFNDAIPAFINITKEVFQN